MQYLCQCPKMFVLLCLHTEYTLFIGLDYSFASGPLFSKRTGVLPYDLVKSRRLEIGCYNDRIALIFNRYLDNRGPMQWLTFTITWDWIKRLLGIDQPVICRVTIIKFILTCAVLSLQFLHRMLNLYCTVPDNSKRLIAYNDIEYFPPFCHSIAVMVIYHKETTVLWYPILVGRGCWRGRGVQGIRALICGSESTVFFCL